MELLAENGAAFDHFSGSLPLAGPHISYNNWPTDQFANTPFSSEAETLAYVEALRNHSQSQWKTLEEVTAEPGRTSCEATVKTSVLTAVYLLGLFDLCATSPPSCCKSSVLARRKRTIALTEDRLNYFLRNVRQNSHDNLEPHILARTRNHKILADISVIERAKRLWDDNPRLQSDIYCRSSTEAVRSSFISLSGLTSGVILSYSFPELRRCFPDYKPHRSPNNIWFFPLAHLKDSLPLHIVRSLPSQIPLEGSNIDSSKCARSSVEMQNGECVLLLSSESCPHMYWVLLNRLTNKGECVPKICEDGRVFIEGDQMCHSVDETHICPKGQRLYMTAWGETVCDCLDGTFYGQDGRCYQLYGQEQCPYGYSAQFDDETKMLRCATDRCTMLNHNKDKMDLPYAVNNNGQCIQLGSIGPCKFLERFGFNIDELIPECVDLMEAGVMRPGRSFTYSHISFEDQTSQFEVSYFIANDSKWELRTSTTGRVKRDERLKTRPSIRFINRRDFPLSISGILDDLIKIESILGNAFIYENIANNSGYNQIQDIRFRRLSTNYGSKGPNKDSNLLEDRNNSINTWPNSRIRKRMAGHRKIFSQRKRTEKIGDKHSVPNVNINNIFGYKSDINNVFQKCLPFYNNIYVANIANGCSIRKFLMSKSGTKKSNRKVALEYIYSPPSSSKKTSKNKNAFAFFNGDMRTGENYVHFKINNVGRITVPQRDDTADELRENKRSKFKRAIAKANYQDMFASVPGIRSRKKRSTCKNVGKSRIPNNQSRRKREIGKRKATIPGIINAPLLNQCRPGARRDYNGYCRPKIIPEKVFILQRIKKSLQKPSFPRIKCKLGEKLNSRGICRKTFRGLG